MPERVLDLVFEGGSINRPRGLGNQWDAGVSRDVRDLIPRRA